MKNAEVKEVKKQFGVEMFTDNGVESAYKEELGRVSRLLFDFFDYRKEPTERSFRGSFENL